MHCKYTICTKWRFVFQQSSGHKQKKPSAVPNQFRLAADGMHFKKEILLLLSSGNSKRSSCQRNGSDCTNYDCTNAQIGSLCRRRSSSRSGTAATLTAVAVVIRTALSAGIISTIDVNRCSGNGIAGCCGCYCWVERF